VKILGKVKFPYGFSISVGGVVCAQAAVRAQKSLRNLYLPFK